MMQNFAVTNTNVNVCCFKANYRAAIYLVLVYDIIVNLVITWNLVSNVFRWYNMIKTYPKGQCIGENCEDPHNFFYAYLFLTLFGCIGLYLSHVFSKSLIYNEARLRTKHMVLVLSLIHI
eukprot:TRINITY_DN5509_c0_g1_i4.p1 TRINITY_DN5509_c0_g1~~TRINITY_DN5509_c0_g1_i4.p1  ORF type:complete len:120 (+),score=3.33 TRINITY_DN5509_c0_g1_i4:133-492(+)